MTQKMIVAVRFVITVVPPEGYPINLFLIELIYF
jgi:hypothetical protein